MNIRKICLKLVIFLKLPPCEVVKKKEEITFKINRGKKIS